MIDYVMKIGIEVHAEIKTKTKAFCSCGNEFGAIPNTLVCPVCYGLPGAIPSVNKEAFKKVIATGIILGSDIAKRAVFERKNFFYPDRPKGYQLVQYSNPICKGGRVALDNGKEVVLNRIHLEEDSGKLIHDSVSGNTFIDFNRSGVPLVELVAEPCELTADEVVEYIHKLKKILIFGDVSDCLSGKGGYRFDVNISVCPKEKDLGTRVELINLNSSKDVKSAIDYEFDRQVSLLQAGESVVQETRVWSRDLEKTYAIRPKEMVSDYRHIADPDLKMIKITRDDVLKIKKTIPEGVFSRKNRYLSLGLNSEQVEVLISEKFISDYFDATLRLINEPHEIAHWLLTDVMHEYKVQNRPSFDTIISAENLAKIIELCKTRQISSINAQNLFNEVVATGKNTETVAKELEIIGKVTDKEIADVVDEIIDEDFDIIGDFHKNPQNVMNFFVGKVKTMTGGRASAETVHNVTSDILKKK